MSWQGILSGFDREKWPFCNLERLPSQTCFPGDWFDQEISS
jgi:hypothetical protein